MTSHYPHNMTRSFNLITFLAYTDACNVQNLQNNNLVAICFLHLGVYLVAPHIDKKIEKQKKKNHFSEKYKSEQEGLNFLITPSTLNFLGNYKSPELSRHQA